MFYFILGVCAGAYFAEPIREKVTILDPNQGASNEAA